MSLILSEQRFSVREIDADFTIKPQQMYYFLLFFTSKHINIRNIIKQLSDFLNSIFFHQNFSECIIIINSTTKQSLSIVIIVLVYLSEVNNWTNMCARVQLKKIHKVLIFFITKQNRLKY